MRETGEAQSLSQGSASREEELELESSGTQNIELTGLDNGGNNKELW